MIKNVFAQYNEEGSLLPFCLPLFFWTAIFIYCLLKKRSFEGWVLVNNIHHVVGMTIATLSLYYDDESIFAERIGIMWSFSYFLVDLIDCLLSQNVTYTFHAICVLILSMSNLYTPRFYRLRMNSKAMFLELSTPMMYWSKRTRNPLHFLLFAVLFTCCRIVWIPFMMKQLYDDGMTWKDPRFLVLVAFYALNFYWFAKIVRILVSGAPSQKKKSEDGDQKKD